MGNNEKFYSSKCLFTGVFYRSVFLHLKRKPAVIFSKWLFFSKFFDDFMMHIIRWNAGEKIRYYFQYCIIEKLITLLWHLCLIGVYMKQKGQYVCSSSPINQTGQCYTFHFIVNVHHLLLIFCQLLMMSRSLFYGFYTRVSLDYTPL